MATWLENQRDKARREKLSRELTHTGTFDNEAIRAQRWNELASAPGQLAQGAFTGLVGAPVDIANMALRPIGLGSDRPVGGSASLASLIRADEKSLPYQAGTMLPISPEGLAIGGAKLAGLAATFAGKGAKTANLVKSLPAKTEFELAHEVAQRNAALPVEQGGLGLPPNNTAMDRAKAMGFDTPAYHGTKGDITSYDNARLGSTTGAGSAKQAHFSASNPETAGHYAIKESTPREFDAAHQLYAEANKYKKLSDDLADAGDEIGADEAFKTAKEFSKKYREEFDFVSTKLALEQGGANASYLPNQLTSGANVQPLLIRTGEANTYNQMGDRSNTQGFKGFSDMLKHASNQGKDSVIIQNTLDPSPTDVYAIFNPANIRSRFAAFDPMQRNSANLLAGGAAGAIGLSSLADLLNQQEYQ